MKSNETLTEKLLSKENRTCTRCKYVVSVGILCRKPLQFGGFAIYHYCPHCNQSVGSDPLPHSFATKYISSAETLPSVVNNAAVKAAKKADVVVQPRPPRADGYVPYKRPARFSDEAERLRCMPYKQYLQTEHWKQMRAKMLRKAKNRCQLCNSESLLNVHHRTYERRGCEWKVDLIVLCSYCHAKFHDKLPKETL